jgi:hypothetical protein
MPVTPVTNGTPANAVDDKVTGKRQYLHPLTAERFTSVTTALTIIAKPALAEWYGKQASIYAVENLTRVRHAATRPLCNGTYCGECLTCLMYEIQTAGTRARDAAGDRGTRFHHVAEQYAITGEVIGHDPDIAGHVRQFQRFVAMHQVTFKVSEVTVLNREHQYGGTLDGVLTCGWMPPMYRHLVGVPLIFDYKTSNHIYAPVALQLAAYHRAETVLLPDGSELPMPMMGSEYGLSIQVKASGFWVRACPLSDQVYDKFLRALALYRDMNEPDIDLVRKAMYQPKPKTSK